VQVTGTGELARALQHETDHLRGELYIDALTGPERRSVLRQIREQQTGPGQPGPGGHAR
jgi:peptide deformylase